MATPHRDQETKQRLYREDAILAGKIQDAEDAELLAHGTPEALERMGTERQACADRINYADYGAYLRISARAREMLERATVLREGRVAGMEVG